MPPLWNEQRQIGITILGKGLDSLFPYPFAAAGKKKKKVGRERSAPLSLSLLPASRFLLRFSTSIVFPVRLSVPFLIPDTLLHPSRFLFSRDSRVPFSISGSSDSRPRRFQSCLAEASTRPHLPLDFLRKLREIPLPLITHIFPSLFRPPSLRLLSGVGVKKRQSIYRDILSLIGIFGSFRKNVATSFPRTNDPPIFAQPSAFDSHWYSRFRYRIGDWPSRFKGRDFFKAWFRSGWVWALFRGLGKVFSSLWIH